MNRKIIGRGHVRCQGLNCSICKPARLPTILKVRVNNMASVHHCKEGTVLMAEWLRPIDPITVSFGKKQMRLHKRNLIAF